MKSRDVVGKRIVKVNQSRWHDDEYGWLHSVDSLVLEDGTRLIPHAQETSDLPVADLLVHKPKQAAETCCGKGPYAD